MTAQPDYLPILGRIDLTRPETVNYKSSKRKHTNHPVDVAYEQFVIDGDFAALAQALNDDVQYWRLNAYLWMNLRQIMHGMPNWELPPGEESLAPLQRRLYGDT